MKLFRDGLHFHADSKALWVDLWVKVFRSARAVAPPPPPRSSGTSTPAAMPAEPRSLYEVLGVGPQATGAQIKKAYSVAVLAAHPDKRGSTEEAQQVNRAYEILRDAALRLAYDSAGMDGVVEVEIARMEAPQAADEDPEDPEDVVMADVVASDS